MDDAGTRHFRDDAERHEDEAVEAFRSSPAPDTPAAVPAAAAAEPAPTGRSRRLTVRRLLFALLPLGLAGGAYAYVTGGATMSTENAYVQADTVAVSTDIAGIVKTVAVHDNQSVAVGDELFRFDDEQFRLALEKADAEVGIVRTRIEALKSTYRDIQAQIAQQQVDIDFYTREFDRQRELVGRNITTQASYDAAQRNVLGAKQRLLSEQQQLAVAAANLAGNPDIAVEQHPSYRQAVAERDEAARQLGQTVVRAPIAGTVTNVPSLQPGMYLAAATASVSVVSTDHVWVQASPKETELTWVRPGQPVEVTVDTYPGETWRGSVESLSPASASSFSLLPAQNTTGNWVKVVQRIPMRVRIETPAGKPPLRVGMSVEVDVETGHARGVPLMLAGLFGEHRPAAEEPAAQPAAVAAPPASAAPPVAAAPTGAPTPTAAVAPPAIPRPATVPHG